MSFEFDPTKSAANLAKHGIDFEAAQALWLDDRRFTLPSAYVGEIREVVIGMVGDRLWAAAITLRGDAIRIVSVRRARRSEEREYERRKEDD